MNTSITLTLSIGPHGARIRGVRYMKDHQVSERVIELLPEQVKTMHDPKRVVSTEATLIIHELLDLEETGD